MSHTRRLFALSLCGAAVVSACSDDESEAQPPRVIAATYNGGLAVGFVEAADARAPLTAQATAEIGASVLCVQEFWRAADQQLLKAATQTKLPHTIFPPPDPGPTGDVPCAAGATDSLLQCIQTNGCDQVCADELVGCGLDNCSAELFSLPPSCLTCVQANVGKSLDDILSTCQAPAIEYAYGGSFGIGLLSAHPIKAQDTKVFESTTNRRAAIYALLDTPLGEVHTFCTHLTAVFDDIAYPKPTGSWEQEQAVQIDQLVQWADEKAGTDGQVLVMGDLNTGPEGNGYLDEVPSHYAKFVDAGYENPYIAQPGHLCTFCADNPIIARGSDDKNSAVIDHVLARGFQGTTTSAKRVVDQGIEIENCDKTLQSAYSDHYGVSVTFSK
jgi:endonuclease/exonuclease/phosphatase family metal-dependent hydrolase